MAYLNVKQRVLECKVVYYGAGLGGKTTNLEQIRDKSTDGRCGDMMSLNTDGDRTLFFDWLPFNLGKVNGCDVKVQLYTVPGQAKYIETRRRVLRDADGIVLVLDSQSGALDKNRQITHELREHVAEFGLERVSIVVQLNKRDLPTAMDPAELLAACDLQGSNYTEAIAFKGKGVFETLKKITVEVFNSVQADARAGSKEIARGHDSGLDGNTLYTELAQAVEARAPLASSASGSIASPPTSAAGVASGARAASMAPVAEIGPQTASAGSSVAAGTTAGAGAQVRTLRPTKPAGSSTGSSAAAPVAAPPIATAELEQLRDALTTVVARLETASESASAVQLRELVAGQRELARRVVNLERSLIQTTQRLTAVVESVDPGASAEQIVARVAAKIDVAAVRDDLVVAVNEAHDGLASRLGELERGVLGPIESLHAAQVTSQQLAEALSPRLRALENAVGAGTQVAVGAVAESEATIRSHVEFLAAATQQGVGQLAANLEQQREGVDRKLGSLANAIRNAIDRGGRAELKLTEIEQTLAGLSEQTRHGFEQHRLLDAAIERLTKVQSGVKGALESAESQRAHLDIILSGLQVRIDNLGKSVGNVGSTVEGQGKTVLGQLSGYVARLEERVTEVAREQTDSHSEQVAEVAAEVNRRCSAAESLLLQVTRDHSRLIETIQSKKGWFRG